MTLRQIRFISDACGHCGEIYLKVEITTLKEEKEMVRSIYDYLYGSQRGVWEVMISIPLFIIAQRLGFSASL